MQSRLLHKIFIISLIGLVSWQVKAQQPISYQQEIADWDKSRVAYLLSPEGWVNLEGLFWLQPGKNAFGSGAGNELVYKNASFPALAGNFLWENGRVIWVSDSNADVRINDSAITTAVIFEEGKPAPLLALGSFRWNIIKREDKIGIRFRDLASPALKKFKGINHYKVNKEWRIPAHLETVPQASVLIANVLGQMIAEPTPGKLVFTIGGQVYKLDAIIESDQLFILFGDTTNGNETYPSGRFLYARYPDENGNTILDFNKAYNPPCAFSRYATCPLPPKQNILPIAVTAGEKDYVLEGHQH